MPYDIHLAFCGKRDRSKLTLSCCFHVVRPHLHSTQTHIYITRYNASGSRLARAYQQDAVDKFTITATRKQQPRRQERTNEAIWATGATAVLCSLIVVCRALSTPCIMYNMCRTKNKTKADDGENVNKRKQKAYINLCCALNTHIFIFLVFVVVSDFHFRITYFIMYMHCMHVCCVDVCGCNK